MPEVFKLAALFTIASCVLGLSHAEPTMSRQQIISDDMVNAWSDTQYVFRDIAKQTHTTSTKVKKLLQYRADCVTAFTHPAFPQYTMRYKTPSLCDPDAKQVRDA